MVCSSPVVAFQVLSSWSSTLCWQNTSCSFALQVEKMPVLPYAAWIQQLREEARGKQLLEGTMPRSIYPSNANLRQQRLLTAQLCKLHLGH